MNKKEKVIVLGSRLRKWKNRILRKEYQRQETTRDEEKEKGNQRKLLKKKITTVQEGRHL